MQDLITFLHDSAWPAWLQAFAAVVALAVSAWAVIRSDRSQRRRDKLQAEGIAVAIYPEIQKLRHVVQSARGELENVRQVSSQLVGQSIAVDIYNAAYIQLPYFLERNIDSLYVLGGTAGPSCLQLIGAIMQHNDLTDRIHKRVGAMAKSQWPEAVQHLLDHLDFVAAVAEKSEAAVAPIHDALKG